MNTLNNLVDAQSSAISALAINAAEFLPKVAIALIVWFLSRLLARVISKAITILWDKLWLNKVADKAGIGSFLKDANFGTLSNVLGKIVYWVIYLVGITMVFDMLDLTVVSDLISSLIDYLPNLFVAILIILIGAFIANMVKDLINGTVKASKSNITWAGQAGYIVVMFSTVMTALNQAQIDISFITDNINTIVMGICLALALAFGLGGKEKAKEIIEKMV